MNNNTKARFKALTKNDRKKIAAAGYNRKSRFPKVARNHGLRGT